MDFSNFIGESFWKFFNELPFVGRRKEVLDRLSDKVVLLVTNEVTGSKFKVVCECVSHLLMTYGLCSGSYLEFGKILSISYVDS